MPSLNLALDPLPRIDTARTANCGENAATSEKIPNGTSASGAQNYVCSVMNCRQYRDAQRWPEPLSFHEFPTDAERKKLWVEVTIDDIQNYKFYYAFHCRFRLCAMVIGSLEKKEKSVLCTLT